MSLLKLIVNHNLIDTERLMNIIGDLLPNSIPFNYFENTIIDEVTNDSLKVTIGNDWAEEFDEELIYHVTFKITNDGNLKYMSHTT